MFERMEITEYIYKLVLEPYYEKSTRKYSTPDGHSRKNRGETA